MCTRVVGFRPSLDQDTVENSQISCPPGNRTPAMQHVNSQYTELPVITLHKSDVWLTVHRNSVWIRKTNYMSLFVFFISLLIVAQHVSGNHVPIIRS